MPPRETYVDLIEVLEREANAQDALAKAIESQREAFVAQRSRDLEQGIDGLVRLAQHCLDLAAQRDRVLAALAPRCTIRTLSALLPSAPPELRAQLSSVASRARVAAQATRVAARVGGRLLEVSRQWRQALLRASGRELPTSVGYDRQAQTVRTAPVGSIVRGTV